jgi:predicted ABC-type ATPase
MTEFVNADIIAQGLSAFNPEGAAFQAGRIMLQRLHSLATDRRDFAFETTLAARSYVPWLSTLKREGYKVHLFFLWLPSPECAIARVAERVRLGGHNVPEEIIRRRYHAGLKNFLELYQQVADTWYLFDNSSAGKPVMIASSDQNTGFICEDGPIWGCISGGIS